MVGLRDRPAQYSLEQSRRKRGQLDRFIRNEGRTPAMKRSGKRTLSPGARKHLADAQRERWAAARKQKPEASKTTAKKRTAQAKKTAAVPF